MHSFIHRILLLSTAFLTATALGQRYNFQPHGAELGLKNSHIQLLHQDRSGFIWVATSNGFYRFDGQRFSAFDQPRGLPSPEVTAIAESSDGTLWAATPKGLVKSVGEHFELASLSNVASEIIGMVFDKHGNLYAATHSGLAVAKAFGGSSSLLEFQLISAETAWAVAAEPAGDGVWFSCGLSICSYSKDRVEVHGGLPAAEWKALRFDHTGKLHARGEALYVLERGVWRRLASDATDRTAPFLFEDRAGGMWTNSPSGASRNGISLGLAQGLASEGVTTVFEDREGSLWIAYDGAGLERRLGSSAVVSFTRSEGLSDNNVQAIADDSAGGVWLGHATGRIDHGGPGGEPGWSWKSYDLPRPARDVTAIRRLHTGALVILTRHGQAVLFDPASGRGHFISMPAAKPLRVFESEGGRVSIAFPDGVYEGVERKVTYPDGIVALDVLKDRSGRLWVAHAAGFAVLDAGAWQRYTEADNLARGGVERLVEGPSGEIWLSYRHSVSLVRLRADIGKSRETLDPVHFGKGHGLSSDLIQSLNFDSLGRLWVSSDRGADVYDGKVWKYVGQQQGLIWDEVNPGAAFAGAGGSMWLGTRRGLTHYMSSVQSPKAAARNVISAVESINGPLDTASPIVLRDSVNLITIGFSALKMADSGAVKYRYRVSGITNDWIETGGHQVMLSNLRPGHYRFEVQSKEPGGGFDAPAATLEFTVAESWIANLWLRASVLAAVSALLAWLLYHRRLTRLEGERGAFEAAVAERTQELERETARVEQERSRAERQNREIEHLLEEAQEASRLKGEFLANMSHEIRTPMNGIIGMVNLALATPLAGDQREYVETARNSAEALLAILNDVLDFSKVEAGHLTIDPEPFVVRDLVSEACKMFQPKARDKAIELLFYVHTDVPSSVISDPGRIRQVLLNLVGNAIKFTHSGFVRVSVARDASLLRFTVSDTGIGIPPGKQKVVFEAFRQADGSTTRRYGGTGLGLAISMKLVSLMGGRIWLESEQGKGSQFHFTVAAGTMTQENEESVESSQDLWRITKVLARAHCASRALRILLAEDNLVNQRVASRMLQARGHHVKVVENGAEALQALDGEEEFDLILMDVQMPEMDGIEATRLIRAREDVHGGHIPVVAMTAHTMKGDRERCLAAGMDAYVNKPIEPESFFKAVEGAVSFNERPPDDSASPHSPVLHQAKTKPV